MRHGDVERVERALVAGEGEKPGESISDLAERLISSWLCVHEKDEHS
jgi:hypothetical protein